jgi:hypothetical protein
MRKTAAASNVELRSSDLDDMTDVSRLVDEALEAGVLTTFDANGEKLEQALT